MMTKICQRYLDGFGMPAESTLSIVVPNSRGNIVILQHLKLKLSQRHKSNK